MKHHSPSKHALHEELKQEAIAEFLGEEEEFHRKIHSEANYHYRRFLIFFAGVMVVGLFVSFAIFAPVHGVVEGRLRSSVLENDIVSFGGYNLNFASSVSDLLPSLYVDNQVNKNVESAYCLVGNRTGEKDYSITDIYYPTMFDQTRTHVSFSPCPQNTVVMMHTHPFKSCLASDTDLNTLTQSQRTNPNVIMVIMCESMRFSVYT